MSVKDGVLTEPIGLAEAYSYLGVGRPSSGFNVTHLCSNVHGKINMWAKYKPVIYAGGVFVSVPSHRGYNPEWWKAYYATSHGYDGDCGLVPALISNARPSFATNLANNPANRVWSYNPPVGGINSPCRLTDFNGYNRDAKSPFGELPDVLELIIKENGGLCSFNIAWSDSLIEMGALTLQDINFRPNVNQVNSTSLSDWYYGVLLYNVNPDGTLKNYRIVTAQNPGQRYIQVSNVYKNVFLEFDMALPLMCSKYIEPDSVYNTDEWYLALPQQTPSEIAWSSYSTLIAALPTATRDADNPSLVRWEVRFVNQTDNPVTFHNLSLYTKASYNDSNVHFLANYNNNPTNSLTLLPKQEGVVWTGTNNLPYPNDNYIEVRGSFTSAAWSDSFETSAMIMKSADLGDFEFVP